MLYVAWACTANQTDKATLMRFYGENGRRFIRHEWVWYCIGKALGQGRQKQLALNVGVSCLRRNPGDQSAIEVKIGRPAHMQFFNNRFLGIGTAINNVKIPPGAKASSWLEWDLCVFG